MYVANGVLATAKHAAVERRQSWLGIHWLARQLTSERSIYILYQQVGSASTIHQQARTAC
jgi:hypothetical protein